MKNKILYTVGFVSLAIVLTLLSSLYIVHQTEQAIVLQFGEPVRVVKKAGLKFKIPFIQHVVFYDTRLLNLDPPAQEIVLNDKKRLDVDSFTRYRIVDPLKFYQTVRTETQARSKLEEIVDKKIPVHIVEKKIECLCEDGVTRKPEKENGKKFETLAVDLIKPMGSVLPFEVVREREFAPIKNKTGVDSVESARELLKGNGVIL